MVHWVNITPLVFAEQHGDEVAEDLLDLYGKKAIDSAAFSLTLVPEGTPAIDKAADYMRRFRIMKEKIRGRMPVGALLQATMGHGWTPDSPADFTRVIGGSGQERYTFCPLDERFQQYVFDAVRTVALERPDFFMLDDDTRLISGRNGCFCKLHLAEFARRTGREWTYESLSEAIRTDAVLAQKYDELLKDSILIHARIIRRAIDSVDPSIPCLFCCCAYDVHHAPEIARALAAPGQELVVRINNARYLKDSPRSYAEWFHYTMMQLAAFPEEFTLLAEPDTCPQNLYSTSCTMMNAQLTFSLLQGCRGGKIWITRLSSWEPGSGKNYRKTLAENAGKYHALADMRIDWSSPYVPLALPAYVPLPATQPPQNWSDILCRMGIPFFLAKSADRTALLSAGNAGALPEDELKRILSGKALLDGDAALILTRRGFAEWIGCRATEWVKADVSAELLPDGGSISGNGNGLRADLSSLLPGAEVLTRCVHKAYILSDEVTELSPGMLYFKNRFGGEVVICGKTTVTGEGFAPFVMLCETRKRLLIDCLNRLAPLDLYIPEEAEVTLMTGTCDGYRLFALLNLGLDPWTPALKGAWLRDFAGLEQLMPDGLWQTVEAAVENGVLMVQRTLPALGAEVFRFQK